jgi:hypothetical protein
MLGAALLARNICLGSLAGGRLPCYRAIEERQLLTWLHSTHRPALATCDVASCFHEGPEVALSVSASTARFPAAIGDIAENIYLSQRPAIRWRRLGADHEALEIRATGSTISFGPWPDQRSFSSSTQNIRSTSSLPAQPGLPRLGRYFRLRRRGMKQIFAFPYFNKLTVPIVRSGHAITEGHGMDE